jgi:hypothetical protein
MLGYFRDFINIHFLKLEYEVIPIKSVDIKHMKSDWYFIKNLFDDKNQDSQNNQDSQDNQETENNDNPTK